MDELVKLNRRIAAHWLGVLDADQMAYLSYASACLGEFTHSAAQLAQVLGHTRIPNPNSPPVTRLNRQFLRFARLAAKDVAAGNPEMVLRLGINREQAEFLANMTNEAVNRLAFGWEGPIIRFARQAFDRGMRLHVYGAQHHATAIVANQFLHYVREERA